MATPAETPAINSDDHGARIILVGGFMLAATALMVVISGYNRWFAKTLLQVDSLLLLFGAALDVVFFSLFALMVHRGFGRHVQVLEIREINGLRKLFLGNLIIFFVAHCAVKISYNLLARRTARSAKYNLTIDAFSGLIVLWTISNIVVTAFYLATDIAPSRDFFLASGSISIAIVVGQLFAFLWIIWRTHAGLMQKAQWTFCMAAFVPLCIAAIAGRLAYIPGHIFAGDWTFAGVTAGMLFLLDLNMVTITVLAPNLPIFFAKTSTGGLNFMPNDTWTARSKSNAESYKLKKSNVTQSRGSGRPYEGGRASVIETTISRALDQERARSAGSNVVMLHRTVEVLESRSAMNSGTSQSPVDPPA